MNVVNVTKDAVKPVLDSLGYELVDVEYGKQYGQNTLTVFIYKDGKPCARPDNGRTRPDIRSAVLV